jgi:spore maturation protein CgeB
MSMRTIRGERKSGRLRIAIADDRRLIYSDDYRDGWQWGFTGLGCEVKTFDISMLRQGLNVGGIPTAMSMGRNYSAKPLGDQVAQWSPDLVFAHHGRAASNEMFLDRLRAKGIPVAVYLCDDPYECGETAAYSPKFDYVFTMDPCTIEAHRLSRKNRTNVFYLPPGVNTDHFVPRDYLYDSGDSLRDLETLFIGNGTLTPRPRYFGPVDRVVVGSVFYYLKKTISKAHKREWIPLSEHPKWYANCKVGLNVHRSPWITEECYRTRVVNRMKQFPVPAGLTLPTKPPPEWGTGFWNDGNLPASHINPRFLEMAACGTLVVSDNHRSELARLFPGAPQASDPEHFLELVLYYLEHLDEAEAIGQKCSYLISRRHSYMHRAAEVLIHAGLKGALPADQFSSLGRQEDWLTPQDWTPQGTRSSSEPTGPSERWSPASGMSWINQSTKPSDMPSVDAPTPWLL